MIDKKKKGADDDQPEIETRWDDFDPEGVAESERPTLTPPFDFESYARNATSETKPSSDTARTAPPPPLPGGPHVAAPLPMPPSQPISQRKTPREVARLEAARAHARRSDPPPGPKRRSTLLDLADSNVGQPEASPARSEVGSALDLVAKKADSEPHDNVPADPLIEMRERFALGDYSGALVMAESLLDDNPTLVEAREYAESCRSVLTQMYTARIGPLDRVPVVEVARDQLRWLSIDHRAGFVLSLVDGVSSLEMILDVSGMPTLDALRILYELVQQRVVSFR